MKSAFESPASGEIQCNPRNLPMRDSPSCSADGLTEAAQERIARIGRHTRPPRVPGISIAVIAHGQVAWARGYGVQETGQPSPVTPHTIFQACSISKMVAAVAALRLVQEERLALDDDINASLVSWKVPPRRRGARRVTVTLRHLLSHTAGLTYSWEPGYRPGRPTPTLAEVLRGQPPGTTPAVRMQYAPGTRFRYSGSHFAVLQQLLEDVTERPFATVMRDLIFDPLVQNQGRLFEVTRAVAHSTDRSRPVVCHATAVAGSLGFKQTPRKQH